MFLEKYELLLEKKRSYFLTDNIEVSSDDSDEKTPMKTFKYINLFLKETRIT